MSHLTDPLEKLLSTATKADIIVKVNALIELVNPTEEE
tara:strand:- start:1672 stop:1785 length:114 start_codon:yes stop_codon:yes gene_type:complete